jgi:uncharacterized protein YbaR (Trm112 family)
MLDNEFLDLLTCPKCKGQHTEKNDQGEEQTIATELEYRAEECLLVCHHCRLQYAVTEDDIPNFLIDEAVSF